MSAKDSLSIDELKPFAVYLVAIDAKGRERHICTGKNAAVWEGTFHVFNASDLLPRGFARVWVDHERSIAVWRNPRHAELDVAYEGAYQELPEPLKPEEVNSVPEPDAEVIYTQRLRRAARKLVLFFYE